MYRVEEKDDKEANSTTTSPVYAATSGGVIESRMSEQLCHGRGGGTRELDKCDTGNRMSRALQQLACGALMESVAVDILGSFQVSEVGNRHVLMDMDTLPRAQNRDACPRWSPGGAAQRPC
ncbi:hypothetical protein SKAU_G00271350 [Synaphobranchus kaupii]|uniref:Uncharacterized protein n=1 Tax=Synaphobranchus kaupii TaxID=118154 RepID=A0A9Q1F0F0_SYNKA|nr:hypothetical protein SKAU_G00271350 [Synaphobranchus kaupii]